MPEYPIERVRARLEALMKRAGLDPVALPTRGKLDVLVKAARDAGLSEEWTGRAVARSLTSPFGGEVGA